MSKKLKAYKRLKTVIYTRYIKNTYAYYDNYDGEFVTFLTPETVLIIQGKFDDENNRFLGWNIYAENGGSTVLLETKSTKKKARRFVLELAENTKGWKCGNN